jgi:phosphatidylinositol alpha-1,6-mannosyltransferase
LAAVYVGLTRETPREVEGFGISLVEAQASGKPVVAGRAGGIPSAVRDGTTGILIDPLDVDAAAMTILDLLEHPDRAAAMGRAGRDAAERHYNWDRVVADLRRIAQELGVARDAAKELAL